MKAKALLSAVVVAAVSLSCTREAEESVLLNSGIEMVMRFQFALVMRLMERLQQTSL